MSAAIAAVSAAGPVTLEIADGLATITLARAEAGNAMNWALVDAFTIATQAIAADGTARAVLVRAEGKNFCVGGDLKVFATETDPSGFLLRLANRLHEGVKTLATLEAPVVIAVQGAAAGAGLSLVAGADLVIAGQSSSYTMAYSAIGLVADGGATWLLPRVIGLRRAQEMAFTNRRLKAAEAEQYGLVTRLVDDAAVQDEALAQAKAIAAGPTFAYGRLKRLFVQSSAAALPDQLDAEAQAIAAAMTTDDAKNAIAAFLDRRTPDFKGS